MVSLVHPPQVLPAPSRLHRQAMEQFARLYAAQDELYVGAGIGHALLFSAHHDFAEVGINDGRAEATELSDELQEHLLHELVDHSTDGRLKEERGGRVNPPERKHGHFR